MSAGPTPESARPGAPDPPSAADKAEVRRLLVESMRDGLRPLAGGLGLVYVVLALSHPFTVPAATVKPLTAAAAASALLLLGMWAALGRRQVPARLASPLGLAMACVILANSLLLVELLDEPRQTTNLALLIIGAGLFFSVRRPFALTVGAALGGFALMALRIGPSPEWIHFFFLQLTSLVVAVLAFKLRVRALRSLLLLRLHEAKRAKELREALRVAHDKAVVLRGQAMTFDHLSESVVLTDLDGQIVTCNPATSRLFGGSTAQIIGQTPSLWLGPEDAALLLQQIRRVAEGGVRWTGELRFHRPDGSPGTCETTIIPLKDEGDAAIATIAVSRDVTERKETEAALSQAKEAAIATSRAKSVFLASMSHELRSPLNVILGYSELLQEEVTERGVPELKRELMRIHASGQRLLELINDILELSKIEADKFEARPSMLAVDSLMNEAAAAVRAQVEANSNTLEIKRPDEDVHVYADPRALRKVLSCLLGNAAKFTQKGRILLTASRELSVDGQARVQFAVTDSGIGMSAEQAQRLFEEFWQGDSGLARKYGGLGLGLALSRRLCRLMGGEIEATSELGRGSTFTVRLPGEPPASALTGPGQPSSRTMSATKEEAR